MTHIYTHSIQFCSKRAFCHRRRRRARNRLRSRFVRLLIDSVLYTIWYMLYAANHETWRIAGRW